MIVAAGLSPALQQIGVYDIFTPGAVNRARDQHWCASGKVLNVGISATHLGAVCRTIAPLGGPARAAIEAELRGLAVPLRTVDCRAPTRVCTTILDRATGTTTELVENAQPLAAGELDAFAAAFAEEASAADVVVLTGSLPAGTPCSFYRDLLARTPARAVLDARGPELLAALDARPMVVKPNREELARTVGRDLADEAALLAAMRELNRAGARWVIVTSGRHAVWLTGNDETFCLQPPPVENAVNPIGCGDALAAGTVVALARGEAMLDALRYGMAAAADRLRSLLPGRLDPARVGSLMHRVAVESG